MEPTTRILEELASGDPTAAERLLPLVYDELRRLAARLVGGRPPATLQPTEIVHEAYLRLVGPGREAWTGRSHFLGVAAKAMRHVLIDAARRRRAEKRGGNLRTVTLADSDGAPSAPAADIDLLDLDDAMEELARLNPRHARIAELRYFAGLSVPEAAEVLGVSGTIVKEDWAMARAWLYARLSRE